MIKELFREMTIPEIFSALSETLCMLVDSIIVGRVLGVECMSAYGLALPLLTLLVAIGTMISCGVQVVCAKALGFGDLDMPRTQDYSKDMPEGTIITGIYRSHCDRFPSGNPAASPFFSV